MQRVYVLDPRFFAEQQAGALERGRHRVTVGACLAELELKDLGRTWRHAERRGLVAPTGGESHGLLSVSHVPASLAHVSMLNALGTMPCAVCVISGSSRTLHLSRSVSHT